MQAMFMLFDTNQDGKISREEFKAGLRMLGLVSDKYGDELRDWQVRVPEVRLRSCSVRRC